MRTKMIKTDYQPSAGNLYKITFQYWKHQVNGRIYKESRGQLRLVQVHNKAENRWEWLTHDHILLSS